MTKTPPARQLARLSDENLNSYLTDPKAMPGDRNSAPYLLLLDTPERRWRAEGEAHTLLNLGVAGRYSHGVHLAANALLHLIAAGREDDELYGERTARIYREREAELRRTTGNPAAIYYPR
jgi:hypothetical protein